MHWLLITSGRGPLECERFAYLLLDAIRKECAKKDLSCAELRVKEEDGRQTIQSALLSIDGPDARNFLAELEGTHKWICQSPFRPNHGRKNWFIGVKVFTEPTLPPWQENELKIETFRSSGPGGQHANKTSSAVRITYIPSGLTAVAQEERSQHRNRRLALARLRALFDAQSEAKQEELNQEMWLESIQIERGNAVRVYVGEQLKLRTS